MATCTGPECNLEAVAKGPNCGTPLCASHYRQDLRGRPLRPLRTGPAMVVLPGVALRVQKATATTVKREAKRLKVTNSDVVRQVLDGWAAQQG